MALFSHHGRVWGCTMGSSSLALLMPMFAIIVCLAAVLKNAATSVPVGGEQGRSGRIYVSPQSCRHATTPTATLRPLSYRIIPDMAKEPVSCLPSPTLEPGLHPRDLGSLIDTINSLRLELSSASASAQSLSASLDDIRSTTATIAASASSAVLAAQASASYAVSSAQASAASAVAAADQPPSNGVSLCLLAAIDPFN